MTEQEWAHMLRIFAGTFGDYRLVEDPDAAALYYARLQRFDGRVVFQSFANLAETTTHFPKLAEVVEACRAEIAKRQREQQSETLRVGEGRHSGWDISLNLPDDYVIGPYSQLFGEMNKTGVWTKAKMQEFCRRARDLNVPEKGNLNVAEALAGMAAPSPPLGGKDRALPVEVEV